jgi:hypothetical protein
VIDYDGILDKLEELLKSSLPDVNVEVEPTDIGLTGKPDVGIYQSRQTNAMANLGVDDPYEKTVSFDVLCSDFDPNGVREAVRKRNTLYNRVWDVLVANPRFAGSATGAILEDGDFQSAKDVAGYYAAGTIRVKLQI